MTTTTLASLTLRRKDLAEALKLLAAVTGSRQTTLPITRHVRLTTTPAGLRLQATNLEQALTLLLPAVADGGLDTTAPAKLLHDLIGTLDDETVRLLASDGPGVQVRAGRSRSTLPGYDPDEFPPIPETAPDQAVTIDAAVLRSALPPVLTAVAADELRPVLAGVHWRANGGRLALEAADGFRLAVWDGAIDSDAAFDLIVPEPAVRTLLALPASDSLTVGWAEARGQLVVRAGEAVLVSQLVQGPFPDTTRLLPQSPPTRLRFATGALRQAVRACALVADGGTPAVRLRWGEPDGVTGEYPVTVWSASEAGENRAELTATGEGPAGYIGLAVRYLTDCLKAMPEAVVLEWTSPSGPVRFLPEPADGAQHVIMPMHLGGWE